LVRKVILAGTGPAGGEGIKNVTRLSHLDTVRGLATLQDPKQFLFFTRTANGRRAGKEFLAQLKQRTESRDKAISIRSYLTQLKATPSAPALARSPDQELCSTGPDP
jgi:hypothetical protein